MADIIATMPWMSYRDGFLPIEGWWSDTGWGCMIRVAQMMLCYTLVKHMSYQLSSECQKKYELSNLELMRFVLPQFMDDSKGPEAPFGIQNIISVGKEILHKGAGEWYGAHSISQVLRKLNEKYSQPTCAPDGKKHEYKYHNYQYWKSFKILTFNEGVVYKDEIDTLFKSADKESGALVIIPLRLGLKKIDKLYFAQLKKFLSNKLSVGILGGK